MKLEEGEFKVGRLVVGAFYFSHGGVLYPVDEALQRSTHLLGPRWAWNSICSTPRWTGLKTR
ncbi:hypothetical protein [Archangium sp.]|uniref:hypothetical protein n=1 Tax=Archangium sp. TaxID=1872627 RepID=UPI002D745355|nr:hypothetical protein [Archangium sp.]HYO59769.1 hypothetical protein [Archangium sp.]